MYQNNLINCFIKICYLCGRSSSTSGSNPVSQVILIKAPKVVLSSSNFKIVTLRTARTQSSRSHWLKVLLQTTGSRKYRIGASNFWSSNNYFGLHKLVVPRFQLLVNTICLVIQGGVSSVKVVQMSGRSTVLKFAYKLQCRYRPFL